VASHKADSKFIVDNDVANALASHNVNFNFSFEGEEFNFDLFQPFKGQTEKLTFQPDDFDIKGEATTLYSGLATITNPRTGENHLIAAKFYVNLF
jgi:hypothetical protein